MSRPALAYDSESALSSKNKAPAISLRVSHPGDSYEVEADRVAERVSRGERIANWSLSALNFDGVQRQEAPSLTQPQHYSTGDMFAKLGEALLANKDVKAAIERLKETPEAREAIDFAKSPAGIAIEGSAAIGIVAGLATAHKPLPLQIPKIPLDAVYPGLGVKVTYSGPVDHPTGASITLSLEPKKDEKKLKKAEKERERAKGNREAVEQEKFREGLRRGSTDPATLAEQKAVESVAAEYGPRLPFLGGGASRQEQPAPGMQLTLPTFERPLKPKHATLLDKQLELKPLTSPAATPAAEEKKKEEIPVQRKAEAVADFDADSADVESVVRSSGRPLDIETRRSMESRMGFDFGKVRVHTDARAAASARAMGARAYTVGSDVVFAAGRYAPQSAEGRRLLAHELTHVVQQTAPAHKPHPVVRPAPRHVQRLWGIDLPDAKSWLLGKLKDLKGYPLFCVVIGEDLITGQKVERNASNLLQGVLALFSGGAELFEKLKKAANAIQTAYQWVVGEIDKLGLTAQYFYGLLDKAIAAISLTAPIESWERIKKILAEPLDKLIELASRLADAALKFILNAVLENFPLGKQVLALIQKAGAVINKIAADPISFAKNLFAAVQLGFSNFGKNILQHLGDGLKRWIFEEINLPDIKMPEKFDFASILQLVLQVLKLTYEQRRPQLVEKLGEEVVYFFETAADIFMRIKREGFSAIWEMIKEKAEKLFDTIIDQARSWVIKQLVKIGLEKVAALATPIGDAIEIIVSIYETIKFFIEKAAKFVQLIDSVVNSFADMVDGKIEGAAKRVEDTLANAIPLILNFLADLLHLGGIGKAIRDIITSIRKPIDEAIGKVLDFVVDKVKPLWDKAKEAFLGKLASFKEWWKKPKKFQYGEEDHTLTVEGEGENPQVFVESNKTTLEHFLSDIKATPKQTADILKLAKELKWRQGELQKPADDEKGAKTYDQLKDSLDHLKAREAPPSKIEYPQPVHSLGGGQEADAFLSSHRNPGTKPEGEDPVIMTDLGYLRKQKSYVRGHLLSMRLGGEGFWQNMMPITNTVNQRMESQVEEPLRNATAKGNRYFHFNVKAKYDSTVLPAVDEKAPEAEKKDRALQAEKRLLSLSWTVRPAQFDKEGGGWKESTGELLDGDGKSLKSTVAQGDFTPPTVT
jgi:Domain of unknown function (DUF4157)/DNA/RNA non-specific endonuclease